MRSFLPVLLLISGCTERRTESAATQEIHRRSLRLDQGWNRSPWTQERRVGGDLLLSTSFVLGEGQDFGGSELVLEQLWWKAQVVVNGRDLGEITGGNAPARATIGDALVVGENVLELRISGPEGESVRETGGWLVDRENGNRSEPALRSPPRIELRPTIHISRMDLPFDGNSVRPIAQIVGGSSDMNVRFVATRDGRVLAELGRTSVDENGRAHAENILWEGPLWSARNPELVVLTGILEDQNGQTIDQWSRRVGIRRVGTGERSLEINGIPTPLMAARAVTRPQEDPLAERLDLWARGGVNAIEIHGESIPDSWLSMTDELGIPVILLPRCIGRANQHGNVDQDLFDLLTDQDRRLVEMSSNHPSVVLWMTEGPSRVSRNNHQSVPMWTDALLSDPHDRPIVDHDLAGSVLQVGPRGASCNTGSCQDSWIAEITGQAGGPSPWSGTGSAYLHAVMEDGAFGGTIPTGPDGDQSWARTWSVLGTALGVHQMNREPLRTMSSVRISGLQAGEIAWLETDWNQTIGGVADENGTLELSTWYIGEGVVRAGEWHTEVELQAGYWQDFAVEDVSSLVERREE